MDYLTTIRQIEIQQARYFGALARMLQARTAPPVPRLEPVGTAEREWRHCDWVNLSLYAD